MTVPLRSSFASISLETLYSLLLHKAYCVRPRNGATWPATTYVPTKSQAGAGGATGEIFKFVENATVTYMHASHYVVFQLYRPSHPTATRLHSIRSNIWRCVASNTSLRDYVRTQITPQSPRAKPIKNQKCTLRQLTPRESTSEINSFTLILISKQTQTGSLLT